MEENRYKQETKELPLREIIEQYTRYWYLFALGVIIALVLAFIYLRYTTALYQTRATIIIKDEKSASSPMEMAAFSQFGSFLSRFNTSKIDNELAIFKSKRIISKTVEELGLNIKYESVGAIKTTEIYTYIPFKVQYQSFNEIGKKVSVPSLYIEVISNTEYKLEDETQAVDGTYKFGEQVSLPFGDITVLPNLEKKQQKLSVLLKLIPKLSKNLRHQN